MDDDGLEDLIRALQEFEGCDHEWRDARPEEGDPPGTTVCDKCGGGLIPVTDAEYEQMQELLSGAEEDA